MRRALFFFSALALSGCANNAFLEVQLSLPAADACGTRAAALEGRFLEDGETECPRDVDWSADRELFPIDASPAAYVVDVEADGADVDRDLCLRVRFCPQDDCVGHDVVVQPSTTVRLERPFVRGARTAYALTLDDPCAVRAALPDVPRCDVVGACD